MTKDDRLKTYSISNATIKHRVVSDRHRMWSPVRATLKSRSESHHQFVWYNRILSTFLVWSASRINSLNSTTCLHRSMRLLEFIAMSPLSVNRALKPNMDESNHFVKSAIKSLLTFPD
jgi:hypothetical protein